MGGPMRPPRDSASFRSILGEKNFSRLWFGQIISSLGDRFYQFALLYVILGIKQGLNVGKDSAQVTFLAMLPGFLLAPAYGWIIDRHSRRWVMFYADLVRAGLTLTVLYFWFHLHSLLAVYVVVFLMGACNGLFIPARQSALPQIVGRGQLIAANSLISLIGVIANFVGVPVASFIVSIFGGYSSFLFNSIGFLVSAWCVYHIDADLAPAREPGAVSARDSAWGGVLGGWNVLREQPELRALVLVNSAFSFISAMVLVCILQQIVVSVDLHSVQLLVNTLVKFLSMIAPKPPVFDIRMLAFGLLMAAIGLGLGIGVALCGLSKRYSHSRALPFAALALLGLALIGFATVHEYWPAVLGAGAMGVLSAFIVVPIEARLQNDVDDARRGRLFALRNLCTTVSFLAGLAVNLNGYLLDPRVLGPGKLIGAVGATAILMALLLAAANARSLSSFWSARPKT